MSIENESVPHPGRVATSGRVAAAELGPPQLRSPAPPAVPGRRPHTARPEAALPAGLLALDALAAGAAAALGTPSRPLIPADVLFGTAALLPALLLLNGAGGLYRSRLALSVLDELPALTGRAAVAAACAVTLCGCLNGGWPAFAPATAAGLLHLLGGYLTLAVSGRAALYATVRSARRRSPRPVLVVGAGHLGRRVAATMLARPEYGMRPVGYLDPGPVLLHDDLTIPVLGGREVLEREIDRRGAYDLVVAAGGPVATAAMRDAARLGCRLWLVPGVREYATLEHGRRAAHGDHLWGFPFLRLGRPARQRAGWTGKRALDVLAAGVLLLLAAPLLAACALAVRLEDGPGVLFRQQRIGLDGRAFTLLKFRTLRPADEHESATRWNIAQDQRVGRVGRFLRRTSLDELPQLWNVLRGEMSMVGPRPERPYFVLRFTQANPEYADRHRVPVGITGLAQIHGLRGDTSIEDRTRFDNHYIETWSLWQDVKILLRTAGSLVRRDGS
ncbi:exopolysaccharide biosynthesis polyprenyl glycosylphosphotransferase [Streptomyces sp. NPDC092296]|uniref:exopolysaccharide biosynthesis polyprenyl glycosylphosphotransferase n=1 Tax=Streptomyces sp. NPDC092296 TaxID=3366012 RepID=UPI003808E8BF